MPLKMDSNQNIKAFMTTQEKSTGKTKPVEHKNSNSKQNNTNPNMLKEASPMKIKQKHKTPKNTKENKSISDSNQNATSTKSDSSVRSPLDGNLEKKQRETLGLKDPTKISKAAKTWK